MIAMAENIGITVLETPQIRLSRAVAFTQAIAYALSCLADTRRSRLIRGSRKRNCPPPRGLTCKLTAMFRALPCAARPKRQQPWSDG